MRHPLDFPSLIQNSKRLLAGFFILALCFSGAPVVAADEPVFPSEERPEQGWAPLASILNKLTPDIDTSTPLTGTQINRRIYNLIGQGQAEEALAAIERREKQLAEIQPIGTDVQLLFLKARAYTALGDHDQALHTYQDMTELYPELPEPWNNLAIEYVRQDKLLMAEEALGMALTADPGNQTALQNLGEVRLLLAEQAFEQAGGAGARRATDIKQLLQ